MRRFSFRINVSPRRVGINRTILAANVKQHQLGAVLELQAEPVPTRLTRLELGREEFMVHPTRALYFKFLVAQFDDPRGCQSRQRNIMRCAAPSLRLLTDTVLTVNDRRFLWVHCQVQLKAFVGRFQLLFAAVPLNLPIAIPDAAEGFAYRGDARASSVCTLRMEKLPTIDIAQREMCKVEILYFPGRLVGGVAADSLPKEGQFESEVVALG